MNCSIGIIKSAYGPEAVQHAFDVLLSVKLKGAQLFLFTDRKFDGRKLVTVRNIESDYPAEMVVLRNMALMAAASGAAFDYYRDGYEVLCLERAVQQDAHDCLVLLRDPYDLSEADTEWLEREQDEAFRTVGSVGSLESYVFDCRLELTRQAISLTADFYRSGAVLSLAEPTLSGVLRLAVESISGEAKAAVAANSCVGQEPELGVKANEPKAALGTAHASPTEGLKTPASWRMTAPLRTIGGGMARLPLPLRRAGRLVWWTVSLQLHRRLRDSQRLRREAALIAGSGLFDRELYLAQNADVAEKGADPVLHYLRYGAAEGRNPGPHFDTRWYLAQNPDVAQAGKNPLVHFIAHGQAEGRRPLPPKPPQAGAGELPVLASEDTTPPAEQAAMIAVCTQRAVVGHRGEGQYLSRMWSGAE